MYHFPFKPKILERIPDHSNIDLNWDNSIYTLSYNKLQ